MIGTTIQMDTSNVLTLIGLGVTGWLCTMVVSLKADVAAIRAKIEGLPCQTGTCHKKEKP